MKVLITGSAGFLGSRWLERISHQHECHGVTHKTPGDVHGVTYHACDLTQDEATNLLINKISPDIVIHTAALTDVDLCEKDPELAYRLNVTATQNLISSLSSSAKFIYISTDQLYDGKKSFYSEKEVIAPINTYGKTKALGEDVARAFPNHLVIRTNFYGSSAGGKLSFFDWCKKVLKEKQNASFHSNVFYTPIYIDDLISCGMELLNEVGTFNVTGNERISKAEFGFAVAKIFQLSSDHIKIQDYQRDPGKALRPLDMSLDNRKLKGFIRKPLHTLQESLQLICDEII